MQLVCVDCVCNVSVMCVGMYNNVTDNLKNGREMLEVVNEMPSILFGGLHHVLILHHGKVRRAITSQLSHITT